MDGKKVLRYCLENKSMPAPKGNNHNPTGKGGFQERLDDIAKGRWSAETSISYNYNKMIRMTVAEIKQWLASNPDDKRTIAQELAYQAVINARKDLAYLKEVTDRTEGKSKQLTDITSNGESIAPILVKFVDTQEK